PYLYSLSSNSTCSTLFFPHSLHDALPISVRMAVGLSMATYNQGETERSEQQLLRACDINPADPTPYLFMGRLEEGERIEISGWRSEEDTSELQSRGQLVCRLLLEKKKKK